MKARVKATGEIVELFPYSEVYEMQTEPHKSKMHKICHLEGLEIFDGPDYWEKLKHQAAVSAMQGMLTNPELLEVVTEKKGLTKKEYAEKVACVADIYATALVKKLKGNNYE